jgi:exosome complex component RRP42
MPETPRLTIQRIREYLSNGKRFDDRKPEEFREMTIETGISKNAEGSARVKLGKTEVLVGIKMDVGTPYPDSLDSGNLMVTTELLPLSSDRFESGPPSIKSIELARIIDRGVRESKMIDFKKLCIKEKEKVWVVYIDIYSINDDGNLLDAAGIATIAALKTAKIPKYDEESEKVTFGEWTEDNIPLAKDFPLTLTIYKIGNSFLVDPVMEEEDASETRLTVGINDGVMSSMQKGDSKELTIEEVHAALSLAEKTWKQLIAKIEKAI